uniref:BHLH domain-containing protein n=1 Tax=Nymphaea colorata TaxID=210225 RepID=A0A5K1G6J9_9MAGN
MKRWAKGCTGTCKGQQLARTTQRTLWRSRGAAGSRRWVVGRGQSIQKKVGKLRRLVPGGDGLTADRLFMKTAGYIMFLKLKLNLLQTLSKMYKL